MLENKVLLKKLEGKSDEEKIGLLQDEIGVDLQLQLLDPPCKFWFAQVFTYCHMSELQYELNYFFFIMNLLASLGFCFQPEETVYLGCDCACGLKQVILYYSISFADLQPVVPVL